MLQHVSPVLDLRNPVGGNAEADLGFEHGPEARPDERAPGRGSAAGFHRFPDSGCVPERMRGHLAELPPGDPQDRQQEGVRQPSAHGHRVVLAAAESDDALEVRELGRKRGGLLELLADEALPALAQRARRCLTPEISNCRQILAKCS